VPGPAGERSLVITSSARALRRSVGLTAWAVLEELLLDAESTGSEFTTQASTRAIAQRLGISKDTAATALRRLASIGLVRRQDRRDAARGIFAHSVYVVAADRLDGVGVAAEPVFRAPPRPTRRDRVKPGAIRDDAQPSLFELPGAGRR
jgi:DNA-binding transcriptional MocR family regulator